MQGADRVNDELEVGFDERFERKWVRAELAGRVVMIAFAAAALAGLLGRGPYSHRTATASGAGLSVDFEPVARANAPTQVTLHVDNPTAEPTVQVHVSAQMAEPMGLERILPQPSAWAADGDGLDLAFDVPPGARDAYLRFVMQPSGVGPVEMTARRQGYAPVRWTQTVLP